MTKMLLQKPPNYEEVAKFFDLPEGDPIFFTYGDTIYNPSMMKITTELLRHEETHIEQQGANPEVANLWWQRYLKDPQWRVEQEAEAYGAQYALMCQGNKDRNYRARYLHEIAGHLSSSIYGNAISHSGARTMILEFANDGRVIHNHAPHTMGENGKIELGTESEKVDNLSEKKDNATQEINEQQGTKPEHRNGD